VPSRPPMSGRTNCSTMIGSSCMSRLPVARLSLRATK
jgi:hypothetical protein